MNSSTPAPSDHDSRATVNHVGVTVTDLDAAVEWYADLFGLSLVGAISTASVDSPYGEFRRGVFGDGWSRMRQARLADSHGVGLELFQFEVPATVCLDDNFTYWMAGPHHVALTVADTPATVERIVASGGRLRGHVASVGPAHVAYCSDPWGNTLELCDRSFLELAGVVSPQPPTGG